MEIIAFRFGWCKGEVQENFPRRERPLLRFGVMMLSLEFCSFTRRFAYFRVGGHCGRNFGPVT